MGNWQSAKLSTCTIFLLCDLSGSDTSESGRNSTSKALRLIVVRFFSFRRGSTNSQCPDTRSSQSNGREAIHFSISSSSDCLTDPSASQTQPLSSVSVAYAVAAIPGRPSSLPKRPPFRGSSYKVVPTWPLTNTSLAHGKKGM